MSEDFTPRESSSFRYIIGLLAMLAPIGGFFALFWVEVPRGNEQALLLALGFVFGWGANVVSSEYGSTSTGRKVTESTIRNIDRAANTPALSGEPQPVVIQQPKGEPVPVEETRP